MNKIAIFLLAVVLPLIATAQNNYRQGYVITNQNDTITGLINIKESQYNQQYCSFKIDEKAEPTVYNAGEIAGYRVEEKYYVSKTIELKGVTQMAFLEFLVKGILNLYYFYDTAESYYFFEDEQGKLNILSHKPDVVIDSKLHKDNRYVGMLKYIFKDFEPVVQNAEKVQFTSKDMIRITEQYHEANCTTGEECINFLNTKPNYDPVTLKFSVYVALQSFNIQHKVVDIYGNNATKTVSFTSPAIGVQMDFGFPRQSGSWSVPVNLFLVNIHKSLDGKDIRLNLIPVQIGVKHTFLTDKKIQPSVGFGFTAAAFAVSDDKEFDYTLFGAGAYLSAGVSYFYNKKNAVFLEFGLNSKMPGSEFSLLKNIIKAGFTF
jgi:hypothetical protein